MQIERLEEDSNKNASQEKDRNSLAMFKCVVRLEIKGCDFFCDGIGYGGDKSVIQQGVCSLYSSVYSTVRNCN